jgi:hypothetical protein
MPQIVTAHWTQDGGLIYVPIGFIPDWVRLVDFHTDTNIIVYEWFEAMEDDQGTGKQEGISYAEGVTANLADDGGIVAYDSEAAHPTVNPWTQARSTAATARTATADGTFIRPATTSKGDKSAMFECVTAGTGAATEPNWDTDAPGIEDQLTDGTTVWERVNESLVRKGYEGIRIAAALQTDGQEMYMLAIQADRSADFGDVDGWTDGIAPPEMT